jgi:hypothetical protein
MMNVSQEEKIHLLYFERVDNFKLFKSPWGSFGDESPHKESVINSSKPPKTQPGLWCQWMIKKKEKFSH